MQAPEIRIKRYREYVWQSLEALEWELDDSGWRGWVAMLLAVLHLIFDYARLFVSRVPARLKALILIMTALVVLVVCMGFVTERLLDHIADTRGPFLTEALRAPYALETRPLPPLEAGALTIFPARVGGYLLTQVVQVGPADSTAAPAGGLDAMSPPAGLLGRCALGLYNFHVTACDFARDYTAQGAAVGVYTRPGGTDPVYVYAVQFADMERVAEALAALRGYARTIGRTSGFALYGAASVDYFQSSTRGWFSFDWVRANWIFQVSARAQAELEGFMPVFTY